MQRSSYLANLAMAQQAHERAEWARKLSSRAHQRPSKPRLTVNGWPLLGLFAAFLWVFLLPLAAYLKG